MKELEIIHVAEVFLKTSGVDFVAPGKVIERSENGVFVSFLVPQALDSTVVIDPPNVML